MNPPSEKPASLATRHYASISQLSAFAETKNTQTVEPPKNTDGIDTLLTYTMQAPFLLTGIIFIVVIVAFIVARLRKAEISAATLAIALFAVSIPVVMNFLRTGERTFTKAGPDEVPRNVQVLHMSGDSAIITWETLAPQYGLVKYAQEHLWEQNPVTAGNPLEKTTTHSATLIRLKDGATYRFGILSGAVWYGLDDQPVSFTFSAAGPP